MAQHTALDGEDGIDDSRGWWDDTEQSRGRMVGKTQRTAILVGMAQMKALDGGDGTTDNSRRLAWHRDSSGWWK